MTLVSTKLAQSAQLPKQSKTVSFSGAQDIPLRQAQAVTQLNLCPIQGNQTQLSTLAAIVQEVTCNLPLQGASHVRDMPHIRPLLLADPTFHAPGRIDMLIGCDLLPQIMMSKQVVGPMGTPMAIQAIFGWAILGRYSAQSPKQVVNVITTVTPDPVDDIIHGFGRWKNHQIAHPCTPPQNLYSGTTGTTLILTYTSQNRDITKSLCLEQVTNLLWA